MRMCRECDISAVHLANLKGIKFGVEVMVRAGLLTILGFMALSTSGHIDIC